MRPDEYLVRFDGRERHVVASRFDLVSDLVFQRSERSIDEFSIRRLAFSLGFERDFEGLQLNATVQVDDSRIFDVAPDAILTGRDIGRLRTVSLQPILVYDRRDDAFAPTRGTFDTLQLEYGAPAFGSQIHYLKASARHSQRIPVSPGWSLLYSVRGGVVEPLGASRFAPIRERLFLGGRTSVRGFEENGIGPRGVRGNPVGGDTLLAANLEAGFPLFGDLGGAAFFDAGGLYLRERGMSLREVRKAAGLGLRYSTPIGPISLDYGFKLDRRGGESLGELHFTIGNAF